MAQIFRRWTNSLPQVGTAAVLLGGALATFVIWYWFAPAHTDVGYTPVQPIPYSHKLHAGTMQMDCRYCHHNVENSAHAGVPSTQVCMNCHRHVRKDSALLKPLRDSWDNGTSIGWKRIHKVPDYAFFNHSAHVQVGVGENRAAIGCVTCHGRVDEMDVVGQVQPLSMGWCLDCHDNPTLNLRPADKVTDMLWAADDAWRVKAVEIAKTLNPAGSRTLARKWREDGTLETRATASCNGCHR